MYQQQSLPLEGVEEGWDRRERPSLDERFEAFHASHPWVYEALEELMTQWVEGGGGSISVKALFEQLRWSRLDLEGDKPFRLNNNFTSRYARLLCDCHPEWADAFQLRTLRTGDDD